MAEDLSFSYVGLCQCGACRHAIVISENTKPDVPKALATMARQGLQVERKTTAEVRTMTWVCTCEKPAKKTKAARQLTLGEEVSRG